MRRLCYRFPYTDTLKILQKWGPGCHFFGHGLDTDIDALDLLLGEEAAASKSPSAAPPALALFTEFPSNPLLRTPDLPRLRALADKYDFLLVVDETLGNFCNVEVLPFADMVVSSLSKVFSGDANVMGGRCAISPTILIEPVTDASRDQSHPELCRASLQRAQDAHVRVL